VKLRHRLAAVSAAVLVLSTVGAPAATATTGGAPRPPVVKMKHSSFGNVLATRGRQALYFWNVEKRDFKVHCTGACARAWPPLVVRSKSAVPRKVKGIKGTFGTIRRPDGRLQVTWNRLPIYTYVNERPGQVLCDNVDGWFVVRV
jgi:predicted lipoprotein with Yx(FWY)xxD motif